MFSHTNSAPFSALRQFSMFSRAIRKSYRRWFIDDLSTVSQSLALEETRLPRMLKLSIVTLSSATAIFIGWAALTPVKEIARTEGQILPSGYNQIVQHLEGGLVRSILVHEGDFVQKNQLLIELDGAGLVEDYREEQALVESLTLQDERLRAVLGNRAPNFSAANASARDVAEQQSMFETMRDSRASDRAVLDAQIAEKNAAIARLSQSINTSYSNLKVAKESAGIYSGLATKGLVSRTTYLKTQEDLNSQQGEALTLTKQREEAKRELSEFERRREALEGNQRDAAYTELHKVDSDLAQAREAMKKRSGRVSRLEVRAPVMGYVKGLRVNTIGAVIPAGQTLLEVVPADEQLVAEVRISPQQIGRVAVGQEVRVKIDSYDYVRFGSITGKLESISATTFTDEIRRQDYYKGRVRLSHNYAGATPTLHTIMPGMTADADIVTGEKSVLSYLLKPIQVAMSNAMTEQ